MSSFSVEVANHDMVHLFDGHEMIIEEALSNPIGMIIIVGSHSFDVECDPFRRVTPNLMMIEKLDIEEKPGIQYRAPHANKPGAEPWKRRKR